MLKGVKIEKGIIRTERKRHKGYTNGNKGFKGTRKREEQRYKWKGRYETIKMEQEKA